MSLSRYLLSRIGKSILIAWFLFFTAYWLNLGSILTSILLAALVGAAIYVQRRQSATVFIDQSTIGSVGHLVIISSALLCANLILGGLNDSYRPIFQTNDAVLSWNMWAIELANNKYNPYNAAYPILFPALWSIIYKIQASTQIWIVAKSTLLILPFLLALMIVILLEEGLYLPSIALAIFSYFFFVDKHLFYMFIGDMDIPAMVMILVSGCLIYLAQISIDRDNKFIVQTTITASIFAGLAAITKQSGFIALIPLFAYLAINIRDKKISTRTAIIATTIALAPLLSFLIIFLHETTQVVGNFNHLRNISSAASGTLGTSKIGVAVEYLKAMLPIPILSILLSFSLLNFFALHKRTGQLGLIFCVCGTVGLFIFADCCSYDQRNGWWILSMFMISTLFSLGNVGSLPRTFITINKSQKSIFTVLAILTVILSIGLSIPLNVKKLKWVQQSYQWKLLPLDVSEMLRTRTPLLKEEGKFISNNHFVKWLPGLSLLYSGCEVGDSKCVVDTIQKNPNSMILLSSEDAKKYKGLETIFVESRLNGSIAGFELYGPFTNEDIRNSTVQPL